MEELVAKGFKAYDLVWLEGKSAAWRYPSEFAELKAHSPVVEEQPYDRFYKKGSEQSSSTEFLEARSKKEVVAETVEVSKTPTTPIIEFIEPESVVKKVSTIPSKKIYVTMPAANGQYAAASSKPAATVTSKKEDYKAYEPIPADQVAVKEEQPVAAVKTLNENYEQAASFSDRIVTTPLPVKKGNSKFFVRSLVAACLILAGVVIGLAISYTFQQKNKKDLEKLVSQIQEREKASQAAANKQAATPVNTSQVTDTTSTVDSSQIQNNLNTETEPVSDMATNTRKSSKKDNRNTATEDPAVPVSNTIGAETVKISPAVMENKEKITYQEAALESARKNIYTLVDVASNKYKIGVLGGISDLYITLSNNSLYPLDQVSVEVKYFGPEKKIVKTQTLLFNDIAPGEQKTLEVPKTNRGVSIDYNITQINSKVLGLAKAK
jgi:hypothetical protein